MSKYKKSQPKTIIRMQKEYTESEIKDEIEKMEKFKTDGKWSIKSWMKWFQSRGAIKVYDMNQGQFGVILPEYEEMRNLEEQINRYQGRAEFINRKKVEGLEELARGMRIEE